MSLRKGGIWGDWAPWISMILNWLIPYICQTGWSCRLVFSTMVSSIEAVFFEAFRSGKKLNRFQSHDQPIPWKTNIEPENRWVEVGRWNFLWYGLFSGDMLIFRGVYVLFVVLSARSSLVGSFLGNFLEREGVSSKKWTLGLEVQSRLFCAFYHGKSPLNYIKPPFGEYVYDFSPTIQQSQI